MISTRAQTRLLIVVFALCGLAAWWITFRDVAEVDVGRLQSLPATLVGFRAVDIAMDEAVAEMLRADANLQRAYRHPHGYVVFVYIGYYGTERGGTPEHTPDQCYPAQGWRIEQDVKVRVGPEALGLRVTEFVVEQEGQERLVHFWYRTRWETGMTSIFALRMSHFWARLSSNRGDGALVRLSTPILDGDVEGARSKLGALDVAVERELAKVWPRGESLAQ